MLVVGLTSLYIFKSTAPDKSMQMFSCDLVKSTLKVSAEGEEISFAYGSTKIVGSRKRGALLTITKCCRILKTSNSDSMKAIMVMLF